MSSSNRTDTSYRFPCNIPEHWTYLFVFFLISSIMVAGCGSGKENDAAGSGAALKSPVTIPEKASPATVTGPDAGIASKTADKGNGTSPAVSSKIASATSEAEAAANALITRPESMMLPDDFILYKKSKPQDANARADVTATIEKRYFLNLLKEDPEFRKKVWAFEAQLLARSFQKQLLKLKFDPTQDEIEAVFQANRSTYTKPDGKILSEPTQEIANAIRMMLQMKKWGAYMISEFDRLVSEGSVKFAPQISKYVGSSTDPAADPLAGLDPATPVIEFSDPALGDSITAAQMRSMIKLGSPNAMGPGPGPQAMGPGAQGMGPGSNSLSGPAAGGSDVPAAPGVKNYSSVERLLRQLVGLRITLRDGAAHNLPKDVEYTNYLPELYLERFLDQYRGVIQSASAAEVTEEQLKAYYSSNLDRYTPKPVMNLNWLTYDTQEEALAAYQKVKDGVTFEELVKEKLGIEVIRTLNTAEEGIKDTILDAIKGLKPGEVSPVISIEGRFLLVQYVHREERKPYNFDIVRNQVAEDIAIDRASEVREKALAELRSKALDALTGTGQ